MRHLQCVNVGFLSHNSFRLYWEYFCGSEHKSIYGFWTCSWTLCFLKIHSDQLLSDLTTHHLFSVVRGSYVTSSLAAKRIRWKDRGVHESAKRRVRLLISCSVHDRLSCTCYTASFVHSEKKMKSLFKRNVIIGKTLIHGDRYLYIGIAAEWIRRCGMPLSSK